MFFFINKILFLLITFYFYTGCYSISLTDIFDGKIENYHQIQTLSSLPPEELRNIVDVVLDYSIELEKAKFNNRDAYYPSENIVGQIYSADSCIFSTPEENVECIDFAQEEILYPYVQKYDLTEEDDDLKVLVLGDLHGNFDVLSDIIGAWVKLEILSENLVLNKKYKIICLGDYVDRGPSSLITCLTLMLLRIINPEGVFLLAGNHESKRIFYFGCFRQELIVQLEDKYRNELNQIIENNYIDKFDNYFNLLPVAFFLKDTSGRLFQFNHGGWVNLDAYEINFKDFLNSKFSFLKISEKEKTCFVWNDILLPNRHFSYRGVGEQIKTKRIFLEMKEYGIYKKFGGHQHFLPKIPVINFMAINRQTPGFVSIKKGFFSEDFYPEIYIIISSKIINIKKTSEKTLYYPSFLRVDFSKNALVKGYIVTEGNLIIDTDIGSLSIV